LSSFHRAGDVTEPNVLPVTKAIGDRWAALSARAQEKGPQRFF